MSDDSQGPSMAPTLLTTEEEFLTRAVDKWMKFQVGMWEHVNKKLEKEIKLSSVFSTSFRITVIFLSAAVTTISNIDSISRTIITITAGVLTALTGIEAYLSFSQRLSEARKQQREIEALRDRLRFEWFVQVEIEGTMEKRISSAKKLLERGPREYNEILTKYALKGDSGQKPQVNQ